MKYLLFITLFGLTSFHSVASDAIVVVANTQNTAMKLSRQEVRNLFMGGALPYDLEAISLPPENQTRVLFNTKIVGLTESRIQSYWAQMRFSGRKKPPQELQNEQQIIEYLTENKGAVGYLPASAVIPEGLTILFQIQ